MDDVQAAGLDAPIDLSRRESQRDQLSPRNHPFLPIRQGSDHPIT
jgi:hypothetical protein